MANFSWQNEHDMIRILFSKMAYRKDSLNDCQRRYHGTAMDAGDTWSHSCRVRSECHCATGDLWDPNIRFQCVYSWGPVPYFPKVILPTKSSLVFELWSQTVITIVVFSSCCNVTLKLTDSLNIGSIVFFLQDVFLVLIGFSKCTKVILTTGSKKK